MEDTRKIDKFMEKIRKWKIFDQAENERTDRIIVWLDEKTDGHNYYEKIGAKIRKNGQQVLVFKKIKKLLQFLKFLFKIKPQYKTKVADIFRIVVENKVVSDLHHGQEVRHTNLAGSEMLLGWLS